MFNANEHMEIPTDSERMGYYTHFQTDRTRWKMY